jgi:hypothetical protein
MIALLDEAALDDLGPLPTFVSLKGEDGPCPEADTHDHPHERRGRVMGWTPPDGICVPR